MDSKGTMSDNLGQTQAIFQPATSTRLKQIWEGGNLVAMQRDAGRRASCRVVFDDGQTKSQTQTRQESSGRVVRAPDVVA